MPRPYRSAVVALKLRTEDPAALHGHAARLTDPDGISLLHVVDMHSLMGQEFDAEAVEQEYWNSESHLRRWGERLGVSEAQTALLVGPVAGSLERWLRDHGTDLLVVGETSRGAVEHAPHLLVAALSGVDCDVLVVRDGGSGPAGV